ncbi:MULTISPECIES: hypothetical protein [Bradyrhizobium]|uniref:Uncharacterized protein n=1 Tax=Bradyrhizobium diversitatis TaxID=2755406 RepID=A0ABS0P760_9BRAD|nr:MULTISPECIES: hypothetical protein [Bradyrhizobium]MBH5389086.1 hypothetical protein [Bradyrhizobium diversitatis]UPJ63526.1 hypothetical protein IVB23_26345 [Bradyrhizobium sp. 191]
MRDPARSPALEFQQLVALDSKGNEVVAAAEVEEDRSICLLCSIEPEDK